MDIQTLTLSEWGDALPDSGFEVFHTPAALSVLEDHTPGATLRLYGGFHGDQVKALVPLFVKQYPLGGRIVSSPPPGMHVPHMGPLVMPTSPKQRKCERLNRRFTDAVIEEIPVNSRTLFYMLCSPTYEDPRPYTWGGQSVGVSFTYDVPVDDQSPETVLRQFSKSRRREIRSGEDLDVVVEEGDRTDARRVYDQTAARFSEQDEHFGLSWPFVSDLFDALGDRVRVYCARAPDGEFLTGVIALYSNDSASFWLGGVRAEYEGISVNTLLHWAIIQDIAADDTVSRYDMVGAGEYGLSRYKSKFNPTLRRYYVVNSGGAKTRLAKGIYNAVGDVSTRMPAVPSAATRAGSALAAVLPTLSRVPDAPPDPQSQPTEGDGSDAASGGDAGN